MNQIIIAGNIGDVVLNESASGKKYTSFYIGHHYRNKDGSYGTGYMYLKAFGKMAETIAKFHKGTAMEFQAHFRFSKYTKDDKEIPSIDYIVDSFNLAGTGAYIERKGGDVTNTDEE